MFDLISIGNISIDLYFKGDSLTYEKGRFKLAVGGKYFVDQFHTGVGGGGVNVAVGTSKLGLKAAVMGTVGNNPFKKMILELLDDQKVSTKLCSYEDNYYNISSILLSEKGERSIIHYSTSHRHILNSDNAISGLQETKVLYLGNMPVVPLSERETAIKIAKKNNILTVINLGVDDCRRPKQQIKELIKLVDILIVNSHEFAELVKAPYKDMHFRENVVKWYMPELTDKTVIITDGEKGSYGYMEEKIYYQKALKLEKITDATGAGDAYTSAFIAEYFKSKDIAQAMDQGSRYAVKILSKVGAN